MKSSRFEVASDPKPWRFWTIPHVWVHVATNFDEPGHDYGQWSARLTKLAEQESERPWRLKVEFLVDEAPWRLIQPGMVLRAFYGTKFLAELTVLED
jgi:hypothetical protein